MLKRRRLQDPGFTLIELTVTVAIVGIVVTALVGVIFEYLRISTSTSKRLNESTDQQFVSAYWQQDVSSVGIRDYVTAPGVPATMLQKTSIWTGRGSAPAGVPSGCNPGNVVVGFAWSDYPSGVSDPDTTWSSASISAAIYTLSSSGTQLTRVRCTSSGSTSDIVARHLDPASAPTVACYMGNGSLLPDCTSSINPLPATIALTLNVQDVTQAGHDSTGYTSVLTAETRQG